MKRLGQPRWTGIPLVALALVRRPLHDRAKAVAAEGHGVVDAIAIHLL
ncbi:MAG: hypothetical protein ACRBN8_40025 [Nannocystales bacterium]